MKRAIGVSALAVSLVLFAITGLGNAYVMFAHSGNGTPITGVLALFCGVTALIASVGLWRQRRWTYWAFLLWVAVLFLTAIVMQYSVIQVPWASWFAFLLLAGGVLYLLARYVRKVSLATF